MVSGQQTALLISRHRSARPVDPLKFSKRPSAIFRFHFSAIAGEIVLSLPNQLCSATKKRMRIMRTVFLPRRFGCSVDLIAAHSGGFAS